MSVPPPQRQFGKKHLDGPDRPAYENHPLFSSMNTLSKEASGAWLGTPFHSSATSSLNRTIPFGLHCPEPIGERLPIKTDAMYAAQSMKEANATWKAARETRTESSSDSPPSSANAANMHGPTGLGSSKLPTGNHYPQHTSSNSTPTQLSHGYQDLKAPRLLSRDGSLSRLLTQSTYDPSTTISPTEIFVSLSSKTTPSHLTSSPRNHVSKLVHESADEGEDERMSTDSAEIPRATSSVITEKGKSHKNRSRPSPAPYIVTSRAQSAASTSRSTRANQEPRTYVSNYNTLSNNNHSNNYPSPPIAQSAPSTLSSQSSQSSIFPEVQVSVPLSASSTPSQREYSGGVKRTQKATTRTYAPRNPVKDDDWRMQLCYEMTGGTYGCKYVSPYDGWACNKTLARRYDAPRHVDSHAREEYELVINGKLDYRLSNLHQHVDAGYFQLCPVCGTEFSRKDALNRHLRNNPTASREQHLAEMKPKLTKRVMGKPLRAEPNVIPRHIYKRHHDLLVNVKGESKKGWTIEELMPDVPVVDEDPAEAEMFDGNATPVPSTSAGASSSVIETISATSTAANTPSAFDAPPSTVSPSVEAVTPADHDPDITIRQDDVDKLQAQD